MRIALLGPVRVLDDDARQVTLGGARSRALVARLALDAGRAVPSDALIDDLWDGTPPADAANALQALVSRLRKALRGVAVVESVPGGYRLAVRAADVDALRFEEPAADGGRELAAWRVEAAARLLGEALDLWSGQALADLHRRTGEMDRAERTLDRLEAFAREMSIPAEAAAGRVAAARLADQLTAGAAGRARDLLPAAVCARIPAALMLAGAWPVTSAPVAWFAAFAHDLTGYAGGIGLAALVGLVAYRIGGDRGPVTLALSALGQRSLTFYLFQSVVWVALFYPFTLDLSDDLSLPATFGVAVAVWGASILLADLMRRAGHRGPAEILLRRLANR